MTIPAMPAIVRAAAPAASQQTIKETIVRLLELPAGAPPPSDDTPLADLARDSFALVQLAFRLQEELPVILEQSDLAAARTLGQLVKVIARRVTGA
jgi:acyl carrier protein